MNIFKSLFIGDKGKPLYGHAPIPPYPVGHNMIHCYRKDINKMSIKELEEHLKKNKVHMKPEQAAAIEKILETAEEFDNLMQAGLDEIAVGDFEIATDYFSDAAFVISDLSDDLKEELINLQQKYISDTRKNFDHRLLFQMQQIEHIRELIIER